MPTKSHARLRSAQRNVATVTALGLLASGCAALSGGGGVMVEPRPCKPITLEQDVALRELDRRDIFGGWVYPQLRPVAEVVSEYEFHCASDREMVEGANNE